MNKTGMNMGRVRQQNRSLILKHINNKGPSSRKAISAASGLTQASVTQITTALIEEGILKEIGIVPEKPTGPGRREVLLDIDAGRFLTFAVNAEPDRTTIAVCDFMGNIVERSDKRRLIRQIDTDTEAEPEDFLERICGICEELAGELAEPARDRIECLAFAVTGFVDRENGISRHAYGIWDREVDIRKIAGERLGLRVLVENNVDAFATAELVFGSGRVHDDLLIIKWGPGVGSSVIIDGGVYHGRHGKTAELGHVIVKPRGKKCVCGRRGCLETLVSEKALREAADQDTLGKGIDQFARSIVNSSTILAPNRIVMFGKLAENEALRTMLIDACKAYDPAYDEKRILHTSLADRDDYIGPAAMFTMDKILF